MLEEFDESLAKEFMDDFIDSQEVINKTLIKLEHDINDVEAAQALFRCVHSVKGNLQMIGLGRVSDVIHKLEDLLDAVRKGRMKFNPLLSDLILLNIETVNDLCVEIFDFEDVSEQLDNLLNTIGDLATDQPDDAILVQAIKIFDPSYRGGTTKPAESTPVDTNYQQKDLTLFIALSRTMEHRVVGKLGKTLRICEMVLSMNEIAGKPVNEQQLRAAALIHDIGMAFLPLSLLNKTERYTEAEREKLFNHPQHSANLLEDLENWDDAKIIVEQHHERVDGLGYPKKLSNAEISEGAKILAIADTFESMSHSRADREHRRTVIRIVAEINNNIGKQFDEYWVEIFNTYVRARYLKKK